jgi:hypothetical protein
MATAIDLNVLHLKRDRNKVLWELPRTSSRDLRVLCGERLFLFFDGVVVLSKSLKRETGPEQRPNADLDPRSEPVGASRRSARLNSLSGYQRSAPYVGQ